MAVDVLLGLQWGDEGKGKIVDYLAPQYDVVCRFQGGPNAGHTIIIKGNKHVLHTIPSGIFRPDTMNVIGNGVVIDPITMCRELDNLIDAGLSPTENLLVARKAHLILPTHRMLDAASEASKGDQKIGSTLRGIGPTYMDKTGRNGLRIGDIESEGFRQKYSALKEKHLGLLAIYPQIDFDLEAEEVKWFEAIDRVRELPKTDCEYYLYKAIKADKNILAEGAQGTMLDIDYGTYPYVTSSNTMTAGVCTGLGLAPHHIDKVIGISKAYCTRVGSGPFPTELEGPVAEKLRKNGAEFGATTGRPRRCGWIDIPQLKYSIMINGLTHLVLTKIDCLNDFEELSAATHYKSADGTTDQLPYDLNSAEVEPVYQSYPGWNQDIGHCTDRSSLPTDLEDYISQLERMLDTKIYLLSTGPERDELIHCS